MRDLIKSLPKKHLLLLVLLSLLFLTSLPQPVFAKTNESEKQKIVRSVAQNFIRAGAEQYQRGYYKQAQKSLLMAKEYEQELTTSMRDKLNELLEKTQSAILEREHVMQTLQKADELAISGEPLKAKEKLKEAQNNELLTEEEKKLVAEKLAKIDRQLNEQTKQVNELYSRSIDFYQAGELEKAREGFVKLAEDSSLKAHAGKTPQDYLAKIDTIMARKAEPAPVTEPETIITDEKGDITVIEEQLLDEAAKETPEDKSVAEQIQPEPTTEEESYIEKVNRKINILRGHTTAVVNDAVAKATQYLAEGDYNKAKKAVDDANLLVQKNQLYLGDELFKQYNSQLAKLTEQINQSNEAKNLLIEEESKKAAIQSQVKYRNQIEREREKRIKELMANAIGYQEQQRYEEALGQLESLLVIDPLNNQALILKQTLEDTINFRKELEVQKEARKERVDLLRESDASGIPFANEITYAKNWREIDAKRKPEEHIGEDPVNKLVYDQLNKSVDLSQLTADVSFKDAINVLKDSIDPPLKVIVRWSDLADNTDISETTPINTDMPSNVPLGTALRILLESISTITAELDYIVENGVIKIATKDSLKIQLETLVYDISVLLSRPADFYSPTSYGGSSGGMSGGMGMRSGGMGMMGGGMGMMGGGMGMMGGGMGGMGGSRGGMGGGGGQYFSEYFDMDEPEPSREEITQEKAERADDLITLIQETIEPESWFDADGEGTIRLYENRKLIVRQTINVHKQIEKLLKEMRKSLGEQISIEARFLLVGENFLEDIGFNLDFTLNLGGRMQPIKFESGSSASTKPGPTGVSGSLADTLALNVTGGFGAVLDTLEADFIIRASQSHKDSTDLTTGKVTVLSGESAVFRTQRTIRFALPPDLQQRDTSFGGGGGTTSTGLSQSYNSVPTGITLNVTPTITPDKKHVLLNIVTQKRGLIEFETTTIQIPNLQTGDTIDQQVRLPQTEIAKVQTRVSVPDCGTLLLGGQKVTADIERETGVPVLSKLPGIGRLFDSRSKIKDHKILLILVRPTIILQEETDADAIATMENIF